jgi:hypothetical protein
MSETVKKAHGEAYCLMTYVCKDCARKERLWNSRDGVTPFGISCLACGGHEMFHENWGDDQYAPEFVMVLGHYPNMRVFVDAKPHHAHIIKSAREYVDKYWNHKQYPMRKTYFPMDKAAAVEHFIAEWTKPGSPTIITASEYLKEHVQP